MSDSLSTIALAAGRESDTALIIGRAVASTVVTMAEMGSIGKDILAANGIKDIDPLSWYPSQLRREIHEAVWQRFGDIALLSFGLSQLDYYPEALVEFGRSVEQYGAMMAAADTFEQKMMGLAFFVEQMTASYHRATSASMKVPGVEICFRSLQISELVYDFTAVTTLAPHHAAFSQGLVEGYIARFVSVDWNYEITPLPERTMYSAQHSELTWRCVFSLRPDRIGSSAEYMAWLKLSYKEKLLHSVISESNKSLAVVLESIRYARHVQHNQLPDSQKVCKRFATFDVLWAPRDTIGGDMWWVSSENGSGDFSKPFTLALTDSTGHGVPGAMLSLLVNNSLERIYSAHLEIDPAEALLKLDAMVRSGLNQHMLEGDSDDGCDAILLSIDRSQRLLRLASARLDLLQVSVNGNLVHHRGARASLGYRQPSAQTHMPQTQIITFSAGDLFVVVTDGFTDQPGGPGERPVSLGHRRLASWVGELAGHSAAEALRSLQTRFQDWQGKQTRRDDVTVITFTL
jgi:serine phosphatase RsbU (regulator of sigma subunit)